MSIDDVRGSDDFLLQAHKSVDEDERSSDTHSQWATCADIFPALPGSFGLRPIQSWSFLEEFGLRTSTLTAKTFSHSPHDRLHHR